MAETFYVPQPLVTRTKDEHSFSGGRRSFIVNIFRLYKQVILENTSFSILLKPFCVLLLVTVYISLPFDQVDEDDEHQCTIVEIDDY